MIGAGVRIGKRGMYSGLGYHRRGQPIGADSLICPGVRIGRAVKVGMRAILHSNTCIGVDGFSFVLPDPERIHRAKQERRNDGGEGRIQRIHSLGGVRIGDDVGNWHHPTINSISIESPRLPKPQVPQTQPRHSLQRLASP